MCPFVLFYWDKLNNFKVKLILYFEIYEDGNKDSFSKIKKNILKITLFCSLNSLHNSFWEKLISVPWPLAFVSENMQQSSYDICNLMCNFITQIV